MYIGVIIICCKYRLLPVIDALIFPQTKSIARNGLGWGELFLPLSIEMR